MGDIRLVLVETAQAAAAIEPASAAVIALSPWAEQVLEERGIPYTRPEDYADPAERERLGLDNFGRTQRVADCLDRALLRDSPLSGGAFRPGFANYFWLKVAIDAITQRLFDLHAIVQSVHPSTIEYFPTPPRGNGGRHLDFMGESMWGHLAPMLARSAGIVAQQRESYPWHDMSAAPDRRLSGTLRKIGDLVTESGPISLGRRARGPTVLALDLAMAPALVKHTALRIAFWPAGAAREIDLPAIHRVRRLEAADPSLLSSIANAGRVGWAGAAVDATFRRELDWNGIDFFPLLESRLQHLATERLVQLARIYLSVMRRLERGDVAAVLARSFSEAPERVVAMAARSSGVPVVAYDHGAMGYFYYPMDGYLDSACADHRLVWGDGVRRAVEARYPEGARPVSVGSPELDRLALRSPARRRAARARDRGSLGIPADVPMVLYVITAMSTNHAYESNRICSDSEYFARQRLIVSAFQDHPDVRLVVKLHPAGHQPQTPLVEWAKAVGISNISFITEPPLDRLLDAPDMFINDSPTTTLLQMLTTDRPVLALGNGAMRIEAEALESLHNAVFYTESPEELVAELRRRLHSHEFAPRQGDSGAFLRLYGTHLGDGRSAERAAEAVRAVAQASR